MHKIIYVTVLLTFLSGCSAMSVAGFAADALIYAETGKTLSVHVLDALLGNNEEYTLEESVENMIKHDCEIYGACESVKIESEKLHESDEIIISEGSRYSGFSENGRASREWNVRPIW